MTTINTLNELAIYNSGRNPQWKSQATVSSPNGPPASPSDGIALNNAVVALVGVDFSAEPGVVYIEIPNWADTHEYSVFIGAVEYAHDAAGDADVEDTLDELDSLLNADGVTSSVVDGRLRVVTEEAVTVSASGGGEIEIVTPTATQVDVVIWLLSGGAWGAPTNGGLSIERGLIERANVAGCDRCYIEVLSTDGAVTPRVGPCLEVG